MNSDSLRDYLRSQSFSRPAIYNFCVTNYLSNFSSGYLPGYPASPRGIPDQDIRNSPQGKNVFDVVVVFCRL